MNWVLITFLLCFYGIVKEFRPATPFLTPLFVSEYKNFSLEEVYGDIYPYWTYSYMLFLIPVFFITDLVRHKAAIVVESICLAITFATISWGKTVYLMQVAEIIFGLASACEIAYFSYIYCMVDDIHYKKVTSYVRSAVLVGRLLAYALGQILITSGVGNYLLLSQISFASVCCGLVIALLLPAIPKDRMKKKGVKTEKKEANSESMLPEDTQEHTTSEDIPADHPEVAKTLSSVLMDNLKHFRVYKENRQVLKWSVWWALATCGTYQIFNYAQSLWAEMQVAGSQVENGWVEFANTLIGAIVAFLAQFIHIRGETRLSDMVLAFSALFVSVTLFYLSVTESILVAFVGYVACCSVYNLLITCASSIIASQMSSEGHGFVFGCNTFVGILLQAALTFAVADSHGFNLNIRNQFMVYAGFFAFTSLVFFGFLLFNGKLRKAIAPTTPTAEEEINVN